MLDVGWTELVVIAIVLIIVVGPKDLPPMLRTFGKMMTKMRGMAGDFRQQFDEALKEADLDDVRKTLSDAQKLNPAHSLREAMNPLRQMGNDIKADLQKATTPDPAPKPAAADIAAEAVVPQDQPETAPVAAAQAAAQASAGATDTAVAKPKVKRAASTKAAKADAAAASSVAPARTRKPKAVVGTAPSLETGQAAVKKTRKKGDA